MFSFLWILICHFPVRNFWSGLIFLPCQNLGSSAIHVSYFPFGCPGDIQQFCPLLNRIPGEQSDTPFKAFSHKLSKRQVCFRRVLSSLWCGPWMGALGWGSLKVLMCVDGLCGGPKMPIWSHPSGYCSGWATYSFLSSWASPSALSHIVCKWQRNQTYGGRGEGTSLPDVLLQCSAELSLVWT